MESDMTQVSCKDMKSTSPEKKLDAAIKRAYREYGPDLNLFFQAVTRELALTKRKTEQRSDSRFLKSR